MGASKTGRVGSLGRNKAGWKEPARRQSGPEQHCGWERVRAPSRWTEQQVASFPSWISGCGEEYSRAGGRKQEENEAARRIRKNCPIRWAHLPILLCRKGFRGRAPPLGGVETWPCQGANRSHFWSPTSSHVAFRSARKLFTLLLHALSLDGAPVFGQYSSGHLGETCFGSTLNRRMSYCARRLCSNNCQGVCGAPLGLRPRSSGGKSLSVLLTST